MSSLFTREAITLQVGHYANFVGCHWWNLQKQETYTPRVVVIDCKGSLHTLPKIGVLYDHSKLDDSQPSISWDGAVEVIKQIPYPKNEFLSDLAEDDKKYLSDLDKDICTDDEYEICENVSNKKQKIYDLSSNVRVWSDFLRTSFHPKSVCLLSDICHKEEWVDGEIDTQWDFNFGFSLFESESVQDEIAEKIRYQAEACESLQGFNVLVNSFDGMGGIGTGICQYLADEYSSKDVFAFPVIPANLKATGDVAKKILLSKIQLYTGLSAFSSLVVPCSSYNFDKFSHLKINKSSWYENSSILAAFLDTATISYRLRNHSLSLASISDLLVLKGQKICCGHLSFPFELMGRKKLPSSPKTVGFMEFNEETYNVLCEIVSLRGVAKHLICTEKTEKTVAEIYESYYAECDSSFVPRIIRSCTDSLKTVSPFPNLFKGVSQEGIISTAEKVDAAVLSCPSSATISQTENVSMSMLNLLKRAKEMMLEKETCSVSFEEFQCMVENYGKGYSYEEDGDDYG